MAQSKRELFRKKSLERLLSPEKLEQLMQVVNPKDWIATASLGALLTGALTWSIFGRYQFNAKLHRKGPPK
jgi:HlyD family secretion protein